VSYFFFFFFLLFFSNLVQQNFGLAHVVVPERQKASFFTPVSIVDAARLKGGLHPCVRDSTRAITSVPSHGTKNQHAKKKKKKKRNSREGGYRRKKIVY
jgi:hypothetical protein